MGSFSGVEHSQIHLKGRSGGSLNTKPCLGPGCSEAPPQQLCQALFYSALLMQLSTSPVSFQSRQGISQAPTEGLGRLYPSTNLSE